MYCKECGSEVDGKFCQECGMPINPKNSNPRNNKESKPEYNYVKNILMPIIVIILLIIVLEFFGQMFRIIANS